MIDSKYLLRDYQKEMVVHVREAWKHCRSVMVQMPTGTGKTHVLASIVSGFSGRVLIVAHRRELISQIREKVDMFGTFGDIRVESIQTVARRIDSTFLFMPDLVVIDEAHHALAKTYRILWKKWPKAKFLGLTATPCRINQAGFTDLFDMLVSSWSIAKFIRKGVLSAFDYVSIRPNSEEQRLIDSLEKRGADGDYQVKEMNAVLNKRPSIERLYRSVKRFAKGKKGIVYAISIGHARQIASYYRLQGINSVAVDSLTPKEERKRMVEAFKAGEIGVLVNVDVFSEGFDCPDVEFVQMARPTLSLSKYLQQVGRGLRKVEGKESCMLIDNVGLYRVFGLPLQAWNWERMFVGELSGKGQKKGAVTEYEASLVAEPKADADKDMELGWVISHDSMLKRLHEWEVDPLKERMEHELKAWQDRDTGLWGLRRGRERTTGADYVRVFGIKHEMAAVRFRNHECGLVDETGKVLWSVKNAVSMRINRNKILVVEMEGGKGCYMDLYNLQLYEHKPEVKRFGNYQLLKVKHRCYSRTKEVYTSERDYEDIGLADKGFYFSILEYDYGHTCLLAGDEERSYRVLRRLEDGSIVVGDKEGNGYYVSEGHDKVFIGQGELVEEMNRLETDIKDSVKRIEVERKQRIWENYRSAMPFQSGVKWGLKVGNRITIPPVYRNIRQPVGKFCAVEKNHNQWGVVAIDGTILIEPKYPEVVIGKNGMVTLTCVTGKKKTINVKK